MTLDHTDQVYYHVEICYSGDMTETPLDRLTGFMQAWDLGEIVAVAVSHGQGRQELRWSDLAAAQTALLTAEGTPNS